MSSYKSCHAFTIILIKYLWKILVISPSVLAGAIIIPTYFLTVLNGTAVQNQLLYIVKTEHQWRDAPRGYVLYESCQLTESDNSPGKQECHDELVTLKEKARIDVDFYKSIWLSLISLCLLLKITMFLFRKFILANKKNEDELNIFNQRGKDER